MFSLRCDVSCLNVILGGGFTGLSSARYEIDLSGVGIGNLLLEVSVIVP